MVAVKCTQGSKGKEEEEEAFMMADWKLEYIQGFDGHETLRSTKDEQLFEPCHRYEPAGKVNAETPVIMLQIWQLANASKDELFEKWFAG